MTVEQSVQFGLRSHKLWLVPPNSVKAGRRALNCRRCRDIFHSKWKDSSHFPHSQSIEMASTMELDGIDGKLVSFDDLLSDHTDDDSIEGLVTVPDELVVYADSFLPSIEVCTPRPDLYACFDPPRNPEDMRRRPSYPTKTPSLDYSSIYASHRVSIDMRQDIYSNSGSGDCDNSHQPAEYSSGGYFHTVSRFAASMKRSHESRAEILRLRPFISESIQCKKGVANMLLNDTRPRLLDFMCGELCRCGDETDGTGDGDSTIRL